MERDVEMELNARLSALTATVNAGFASLDMRFDHHQADVRERHQQTMARLASIESEAKRTNGRVSELETDRAVRLFASTNTPEHASLTLAGLKWYIAIIAATGGATIAALKALGFLA